MKKGQDRASILVVRLKPSERKALQAAADKAEKAISTWARDVLLTQADIR